nr:hypothetical protein [Tanacetum cinerariifolium]
MKSDEVIKSSVKNLVQIPSEYEVTSDDEKINSNKIDPHYFNAESDIIESLSNRDTFFDSSPKFDYLEEFSGELMLTSVIDDEIDIFTGTDDLMPLGIESDDYDSEGDIQFFEELLSNDTPPIPENESSNFDHHDDSSFPRPLPEPPDVKIFFESDSGVLTTNVVKGISEHDVLMPNIFPPFPPLIFFIHNLKVFETKGPCVPILVSVRCQKPGHLAARLGCAETKVVTWDDLAFKLITLGWNVKH